MQLHAHNTILIANDGLVIPWYLNKYGRETLKYNVQKITYVLKNLLLTILLLSVIYFVINLLLLQFHLLLLQYHFQIVASPHWDSSIVSIYIELKKMEYYDIYTYHWEIGRMQSNSPVNVYLALLITTCTYLNKFNNKKLLFY